MNMSVKVENRPINRFGILGKFNELTRNIMFTINTDSGFNNNRLVEASIQTLIQELVNARKNLKLFNSETTYNEKSYERRRFHQGLFNDNLEWLSAFFTLLAQLRVKDDSDPKDFGVILNLITEIQKMLKSLKKTDEQNFKDGPVKTKEKFKELRKKDFVVEHEYDNTKITQSAFNSKDKMRLNEFVFIKPEDLSSKETDPTEFANIDSI